MRAGCTCHIGMCITWWCWLDPGVCSPCCPRANRWQCGPQRHKEERMDLSGQTHASLRSSVYHRLRSLFWLKRMVLFCLSLAVSHERPRRWCGPPSEGAPTEAVASPREAVGADGKRHFSQRAGLARETCVRRRNHFSRRAAESRRKPRRRSGSRIPGARA